MVHAPLVTTGVSVGRDIPVRIRCFKITAQSEPITPPRRFAGQRSGCAEARQQAVRAPFTQPAEFVIKRIRRFSPKPASRRPPLDQVDRARRIVMIATPPTVQKVGGQDPLRIRAADSHPQPTVKTVALPLTTFHDSPHCRRLLRNAKVQVDQSKWFMASPCDIAPPAPASKARYQNKKPRKTSPGCQCT